MAVQVTWELLTAADTTAHVDMPAVATDGVPSNECDDAVPYALFLLIFCLLELCPE